MNRRFTGNELFRLRNFIPIDWLIEDNLNIPSKQSEVFSGFYAPCAMSFKPPPILRPTWPAAFCAKDILIPSTW